MKKTLYQIAESCIETPQGGVFSDESNISFNAILNKINECRGIVAQMQWTKNKRFDWSSWLQRFYPEYVEEIQEKCHVIFKVPDTIPLGYDNGIQYVGSRDYANGFRKVREREEWSTMLKHPVMRSRANNSYLFEAVDMEIYSLLKPRDLMVVLISGDPRDIPTYNVEKDPYPVDEGSIEMIEDLVRNKVIMMSEKTPADQISDSQDKK